MMSKYIRPYFIDPMSRLAHRLHQRGVTPNAVTIAGFVLTLLSTVMLAMGNLFWGAFVLWGAAMFDMLDGALARYANQVSKFGAFLDSTLDRYSESITFLGLAFYFSYKPGSQTELFLIFLTLIGSWMVSYTRARAEGLGIECKVGILQRPERLTILIAGLILGLILPTLWILAIFTNVTAIQRIYEVYTRVGRVSGNQSIIE
jgi:CDP-diacylglycerol--glycerol-3-phosphate 3-phosphatidyltransferase